ncbi:MAG: 3-phosphoshikimate 1-carboxyvinyltransferase [Bacteroidota bacterium]|nr:3-phosphoshikimate 1-carboxyvinyltransferase [Bacteroidota bacterium]MDP4234365.1 3-phosphoshikimate 1-carboxyvinyltransferase [Bacteroidota bacterium]MDP4243298.1 3-phosphoshikimate 1-carboxyvinyltransferase [Bacteroidota bacterium]MDP4287983.1 3-phosphoshikimate 1-carboxyvinyltransferase [Bacteroidota bacterium]
MTVTISPIPIVTADSKPCGLIVGPDKSILHRLLILGSLTRSLIRIPIRSIESLSHDVLATVLGLESLGVPIEITSDEIELQGVGRHGFRAPGHTINCANSGTTARLLMGLLAGQSFESTLAGDRSLSARPMKRLADLLVGMGAAIETTATGSLPVKIKGRALKASEITLPVASAQMKTSLLLAALFADGRTSIREPLQSRDHTERMMTAFGYDLVAEPDRWIRLEPSVPDDLEEEFVYEVPGDISSAAFGVVAGILLHKHTELKNVSLNPTRTRYLDILALMGVEFEATNVRDSFGEARGDLHVYGDRMDGPLAPFEITPDDVPLLLDEIPILATLALFADGTSTIRGARELRVKETDRLRCLAQQFTAFGAEIAEVEDGLSIVGIPNRTLRACAIDHGGDHRLVMAFAIAGLFADNTVTVPEAEIAAVSYPEFFEHLAALAGEHQITYQR